MGLLLLRLLGGSEIPNAENRDSRSTDVWLRYYVVLDVTPYNQAGIKYNIWRCFYWEQVATRSFTHAQSLVHNSRFTPLNYNISTSINYPSFVHII